MQSTAVRAQGSGELAKDLCAVVVYLLKTSHRAFFEAVGELELSISQLKALHVLEDSGEERTLKDLAETLGLSLPAASRAIDSLHQRGWVERREDAEDRRMRRLRITPGGRRVVQTIEQSRLSILERFVEGLSERERRQLASGIAPILERESVASCRPRRGGR